MKAPFFIVGVPRSGTTLLSVLLSNHPQVYIDGESVGISIAENMEKYKRLFAYRPGRGQRAVLTQVIRDSYKQRLEKLLDYEQLDQYADLRDFFRRSVNRRAEEHGKLLWGDKTPELIFHLPQLLQVFPEARFLHVVRDARSNAQSLSKRQYMDFQLAVQYWKDINAQGLVYRQIFGEDQYRLVSYERLLSHPDEELRTVCDHLGIPFDPAMLDLEQNEATQSADAYVQKKIDASKLEAWKEKMSRQQIRTVEAIAGDLLETLDYELLEFPDGQQARSLSYGRRWWLQQKDLFRLLFKARRVQMIDRKLHHVRLSWRRRFKNFFFGTIKHTFSESFIRIFKPVSK